LISHQFYSEMRLSERPHINTIVIGILIDDERNRMCSMLALATRPSLSSFCTSGEDSDVIPSAPEFDALHM
jgi:hypothetical protein